MGRPLEFTALLILALTGGTPAAHAATCYAVTQSGNVITFQTGSPSMLSSVALQGIPMGQEVEGIDRRPADGKIYLLTTDSFTMATGRLYTLNPSTGIATIAVTLNQQISAGFVAMDFDPVADQLRIITGGVQNLRVNPTTGGVTFDTQLDWAPGDPNEALFPALHGIAGTNNFVGAGETALFGVDAGAHALIRIDPAGGGVLHTVGSLGVQFGGEAAFDVAPSPSNHAYAALRIQGPISLETHLFLVDLSTGHATDLGRITGADLAGFTLGADFAQTAFSRNQTIRIVSNGQGYQELSYNYTTGQIFVTPYNSATAGVARLFPLLDWAGVFHYDYAAGAYTQAVYSRDHLL